MTARTPEEVRADGPSVEVIRERLESHHYAFSAASDIEALLGALEDAHEDQDAYLGVVGETQCQLDETRAEVDRLRSLLVDGEGTRQRIAAWMAARVSAWDRLNDDVYQQEADDLLASGLVVPASVHAEALELLREYAFYRVEVRAWLARVVQVEDQEAQK